MILILIQFQFCFSVVDSVLMDMAFNQLRDTLEKSTRPQIRLRAATFGRNRRDDCKEDGSTNALHILLGEVQFAMERQKNRRILTETNLKCNEIESVDQCIFPNGLQLHCHYLTAPEETAFIYDEIFTQRIYFNHGIALQPGDTVIDVGANVGMFSIFAELQWGDYCNALRIIAVEPITASFVMLQKNMAKFAPSAVLLHAAVGNPRDCSHVCAFYIYCMNMHNVLFLGLRYNVLQRQTSWKCLL